MFEAARHVGIGGYQLTDDERIQFVDVLRRASRKARAQASFPLALEYCRNGLGLLGESRWAAHFLLTRELQLDAAEAALLLGDAEMLHGLLDEAEEGLHAPADRARLAFLRLKGRVAQNRLQEALETGLRALDELGEPLPRNAGKPRMANALMRFSSLRAAGPPNGCWSCRIARTGVSSRSSGSALTAQPVLHPPAESFPFDRA